MNSWSNSQRIALSSWHPRKANRTGRRRENPIRASPIIRSTIPRRRLTLQLLLTRMEGLLIINWLLFLTQMNQMMCAEERKFSLRLPSTSVRSLVPLIIASRYVPLTLAISTRFKPLLPSLLTHLMASSHHSDRAAMARLSSSAVVMLLLT